MDSSIDALPYFDREIENIPGLKELAKAEIEKELRNVDRQQMDQDPRIPVDIDVFPKSASLQALLDAVANPSSDPLNSTSSNPAIDNSKLLIPSIVDPENSTEEELREIERRIRTGLGHVEVRNINANLLSTYAPNAWLIRNYQLESQAKELEAEVEVWKEKVVEVNRKRRVFQEATGKHLQLLESRWQDLVSSTVQLEMANIAVKGEVEGLRRKAAELEKELEA